MKELVVIAALLVLVLTVALPLTAIQGLGTLAPTAPITPITPITVATVAPRPGVGTPVPTPFPAPGITATFADILRAAMVWVDARVPYLWGGCTMRGVDCSCFEQNVYRVVGINVPRTTVEQKAYDRPIPRDQIQPGDTLFFDNTCVNCGPNPTHEGLYIGGGMMIDAGDPVHVEPVYWSKFDSAGRPPGL